MSTIHFEAQLFEINSWIILRLPESASAKLPSRGMTMVSGTINGAPFRTLLEPDGRYAPGKEPSHWFRPDRTLLDDASAKAGDTVHVSLEPPNEWIEPEIREDVRSTMATSFKAEGWWKEIRRQPRWGWIRWKRELKTPETRPRPTEGALDKLNKGMRRPCCSNRNRCGEPYV